MTATIAHPLAVTSRTAGVVIGLASALGFASSGPVVKPLLEAGWSVGAALLLRMGGAALLLSPWLIRAFVRDRSIVRRHGALIVGFGLTGVAGCQLFFFSAMQRMPVAIALLVQYIAPVLLVAWVWMRTHRRPSALVLGGTAVAVVGLVFVIDLTGAAFDPIGMLLALGAAVCLAAYFALAERTTAAMPPVALAAGGLFVGAVLSGVLCLVGVLPFVAPAVTTDVLGASMPWFVSIAWVALVATAFGYGLGILAVPRMGARLASFVGLTEVLFAMIFAWMLLGEAPTLVQAAGGVLILAGVVLVRADPAAVPREVATAPAVPVP